MQAVEHLHDHHHDGDHEHNHRRELLLDSAKTALLVGLALYFAANILSGNLTNYINERFAWLSYVAVVLFLLLALGSTMDLWRHRGHHHHNHEHDDHNHVAISWPVLAVVAVPLLLGTLIPSRPLGSAAVDGNISLSAASVTGATTFTTDPAKWNVLDWLRAFSQSDDINSFNGKEANIIGFVYKEPTFIAGSMMIARFTVSCCVADASAIGLPVTWKGEADLPADTWVQVKGTFQVGSFRDDTVPILQATSVEVVAQPEHPYLYP
ncbi:MAG: TIGR03943 family protein [Anaerolineae bacterium]